MKTLNTILILIMLISFSTSCKGTGTREPDKGEVPLDEIELTEEEINKRIDQIESAELQLKTRGKPSCARTFLPDPPLKNPSAFPGPCASATA